MDKASIDKFIKKSEDTNREFSLVLASVITHR